MVAIVGGSSLFVSGALLTTACGLVAETPASRNLSIGLATAVTVVSPLAFLLLGLSPFGLEICYRYNMYCAESAYFVAGIFAIALWFVLVVCWGIARRRALVATLTGYGVAVILGIVVMTAARLTYLSWLFPVTVVLAAVVGAWAAAAMSPCRDMTFAPEPEPAPVARVQAAGPQQIGYDMSGRPMYATQAPSTGSTNTMAIVSLITSILGIGIVGVICGHVAMGQIGRSGESGRGMALAGLIIGYVLLALQVIGLIVIVAFYGGLASAS